MYLLTLAARPAAAGAAGPHGPGRPRPRNARRPPRRRERLEEAVVDTATRLLPLLKLLDAIQPQVGAESVFRTRRKKIRAHWDELYAELRAERPRHQALLHSFGALAELVRAETHDLSKDEVKQAAKELALATLQNAPALLNVARQARLLE